MAKKNGHFRLNNCAAVLKRRGGRKKKIKFCRGCVAFSTYCLLSVVEKEKRKY